ncbi:MAG: glycosyltransferase, partial [Armatimonadetes bacterium]|nr:glycosyltransferase [Armatimonadota bacterium]
MPIISVVVPNWNGEHLLRACLDSLRRQTLSDIEVIVSDDGSTDGSIELLATVYPEVVTLRSSIN